MIKFESLKPLSTFALLCCIVVACKESGSRDKPKTVKSADGKYQMTVPDGWTSGTAESKEIMRVLDTSNNMIALVSSESKVDLADGMTLEKYTEAGRNNLLNGPATDATMPQTVTAAGGEARQYEATIPRENVKYKCLVTAIDGPEQFFRVNACAPPSKFDQKKTELKQLSESFRPVLSGSDSNQTSSP